MKPLSPDLYLKVVGFFATIKHEIVYVQNAVYMYPLKLHSLESDQLIPYKPKIIILILN